MLDLTPIRSAQNAFVKRARAVLRGADRERLVLEGERLVEDALRAGLAPEFVLVAEERAELAEELSRVEVRVDERVEVRVVASDVLASLSALDTSPGVLAVCAVPERRALDALPTAADALAVVAFGVQDPGNLGALARTAEAAGGAALVTVGGCRPWNEKALRGSMGSLLRLPVFEASGAAEAWDALVAAGFRPVVARTRGGVAHDAFDWSGRVAVVLTGETGRLPDELTGRAERARGVTIPMAPSVESLNVTTAAAVLLFAAGRNRGGSA